MSERDIERILVYAALTSTAAVALGVGMHLLGITVATPQRLWQTGEGSVARAGGLTGNSGSFGALTGLSFVIVQIVFSGRRATSLPRWLRPANIVVCSLAILFSSSRGGLVLVVVASVVWMALQGRRAVTRVAAGGGALLAGLMIVDVESAFVNRSLQRLDLLNLGGDSTFTASSRSVVFRQALDDFAGSQPLIGVGYKQYADTFGRLLDNAYLLSLLETGLIGAALFGLFWVHVLREANWASKRAITYGFPAAALPLLVGFMARMMTGGTNASWYVAPTFYLVLGLLIRQVALRSASASQERPEAVSSGPLLEAGTAMRVDSTVRSADVSLSENATLHG
ncbi:MAG: O-antigen ligase family protein [Actinomycetota bacterium]